MVKSVCVYCASSTKISPLYLDTAYELGKILAAMRITVVYGGGSVGSMGALAKGTLSLKGEIIGVIPEFMMKLEWGNPNITRMIVVDTMAERKKMLIDNIDAVVVLPGGTGTLEEVAEVLSLKKLGMFQKPIIFLNTNGFFDHLIAFFNRMSDDNFILKEHNKMYSVVNSPNDVLKAINEAPEWNNGLAMEIAAI